MMFQITRKNFVQPLHYSIFELISLITSLNATLKAVNEGHGNIEVFFFFLQQVMRGCMGGWRVA